MPKYALLLNPGHNRVYYNESQKLSISELKLSAAFLDCEISDIKNEIIANIPYCVFTASQSLDSDSLVFMSNLSFVFALFEVKETGADTCLIPIKMIEHVFINDDITTILKYKGKTNELFTKMMVNIASMCCKADEGSKLLDPMAGKGTTLFEGMTRGYNVCGIEQSKQSAHEGYIFAKKYLEQARMKHITKTRTITTDSKKAIGKASSCEYALSKEDFKAGNLKQLEMITGDSCFADKYYKLKYFDMIVCDLPYGVQHFGKSGKNFSRSPLQLLKQSLPSWKRVLKNGGCMVLAFNLNTMTKKETAEALKSEGFSLLFEDIPFSHFVDTSIQRDIIIAKK